MTVKCNDIVLQVDDIEIQVVHDESIHLVHVGVHCVCYVAYVCLCLELMYGLLTGCDLTITSCVLRFRAQSLSDSLNRHGWPSTHISATLDQRDRLSALSDLKLYKCRVLVSTDLVSRCASS